MKKAMEILAYLASIALLYGLLLYAGTAHAGAPAPMEYFEGRNEFGNKVILLDKRPQECGGFALMFEYERNGTPHPGCWTLHAPTGKVLIQYENGIVKIYEQWEFTQQFYPARKGTRRYPQ